MTGQPLKRVRVLVEGRVQGVNFRHFTSLEARRLGLAGWVRNLSDGRVEAVYEGGLEAVEEMIEWTRHGPDWARVTDLVIRDEAPQGEQGFHVR
jgi:acylphosphatase